MYSHEGRNDEVKLRNKLGYKKWARKRKYGQRWPATEGIFSAMKRIFGEQLTATSEKGMLQETACKIWAYQKFKRGGEVESKPQGIIEKLCNTAIQSPS